MTYWEIAELVEAHGVVLCSRGDALFVSRAPAPEGYVRMRCHYCDTDVLLAKWVVNRLLQDMRKGDNNIDRVGEEE